MKGFETGAVDFFPMPALLLQDLRDPKLGVQALANRKINFLPEKKQTSGVGAGGWI